LCERRSVRRIRKAKIVAVTLASERERFSRYQYVYWILTRRLSIRCDHCGKLEMLRWRIGPEFLEQQLSFYAKHAHCTNRYPTRRVLFHP
jgi:hypothetical protein